MDTLLQKLNDARTKDLILHYLKGITPRRIDTNELRKLLLPNFSYTQIKSYVNNLISDGSVNSAPQDNSPIIWHIDVNDKFIESGGNVRSLFSELMFNNQTFIESYHKDLILCLIIYNGVGTWSIADISTMLFPKYEDETMRRFSDELCEDGYVIQGSTNAKIQYTNKAFAFIEEGGYVGKYLMKLKEQVELRSEAFLKMEQKKKKIADRKEYNENFQTNVRYGVLRYGTWIVIGLICLVGFLTLFGFIPKEQATQGFKWLISIFK
jgi:hypothetical protein